MGFQVIKYLEYLKSNFATQLEGENLTATIKNDLEGKLDFIDLLKEKFEFQLSPGIEKQATRLGWVAMRRKREKPVEVQLKTIRLYDKINEVLPYLSKLNRNNKYQKLIALCLEELDLIDFSGMGFGNKHVSEGLMHDLFNDAIQGESISENPTHPEAVQKLKELYQEFKKTLSV